MEPPPRRRRKLSAIMMADVSGFSRMMGADEDGTVDLIKDFHRRVRVLVEQFEGRVVETAGDSVLGEFDSVVNAVRCACRIQEEQGARNVDRRPEERIDTRIGVHLGDVIVEDYGVYGDGVNIAARLEPLADPGGICISEAVYQQVRNKLELSVQDIGLRELKNIEHPIRLYKVPPFVPGGDQLRAPARPSPAPTRSARGTDTALASWLDDIVRADRLILLILGGFLLLSPVLLIPTGGVFPTVGAIVLAIPLGRVWARRSPRAGRFLVALGIGLASGALWTSWSRVTDVLFILAGLIVVATGMGVGRRRKDRAFDAPAG